jgi:DNA-binding beta-propeller fold protein YncE
MRSLRFVFGGVIAAAVVVGSFQFVGAKPATPTLTFSKVWTHNHTDPGQLSEIPAFDQRTNTIWVAGVVGVDVLDAEDGSLIKHIDVTPHGAVNSVAIHNGLAAFAIEAASRSATCASCDRRNAGKVLFYDTVTRAPDGAVTEVEVGALPDMLTFTHDGSKLLVANEGTPNPQADVAYVTPDPPGSVTIIDMATRTVLATATLNGLPTSGTNIRFPISTGMDFEPEYVAVNHEGTKAFVTLQEGNAIGVLDLVANEFTEIIGLGAKDFSIASTDTVVGNEIDPKDNDGTVVFRAVNAKGLYMPDSIATYRWNGETYLVMANEGDFREDNADRSTGADFGFNAASFLDRLRVSNRDSSNGNIFATGGRSFSIRRENGEIVYDSASILDREAHKRLVYDNGRSRDKGVEPEGVALLTIRDRTFAFIGLERTTKATIAIFDITDLDAVRFVDMIVTTGDLSPEGLAAYKYRGNYYLAIANEVPAPGATTTNTTLYRLDLDTVGGED